MSYWEKLTELGFDINAIKMGNRKLNARSAATVERKTEVNPVFPCGLTTAGRSGVAIIVIGKAMHGSRRSKRYTQDLPFTRRQINR